MDRYDYVDQSVPNEIAERQYVVIDRQKGQYHTVARCEDGDDARLIVRLLNAHDAAVNEQARDNVEGHPA